MCHSSYQLNLATDLGGPILGLGIPMDPRSPRMGHLRKHLRLRHVNARWLRPGTTGSGDRPTSVTSVGYEKYRTCLRLEGIDILYMYICIYVYIYTLHILYIYIYCIYCIFCIFCIYLCRPIHIYIYDYVYKYICIE